jgi:predicted enzyme related to lactoylglutathione lyase
MTRIRTDGEFCWINVLSPQPRAAREFFGELLGWTFVEIPNMGHRIQVSGRDVGGLFDTARADMPPGIRAGIGSMVKVTDADATCARVIALGGIAKPAFDIGAQGRMAECVDPNGAMFDLWQPYKSPGMTTDVRESGAPTWFETITSDAARATEFYSALFGWQPVVTKENPDYTLFSLNGENVAGLFQIRPDMQPMPSHWGVYFAVDDVDAAAAKAVALGASNFLPARDIPATGRFAGVASPQGVWFYVFRGM